MKDKKNNLIFHFVDIPRNVNLVKQLKAAIQIRKLVNYIKPDLIHIHFTTAAFPSVLLRLNNYSYFATIHGLGMNSSIGIKKIIFTFVEFYAFIRLDKIFVVKVLGKEWV